jgi:hypothetical protein
MPLKLAFCQLQLCPKSATSCSSNSNSRVQFFSVSAPTSKSQTEASASNALQHAIFSTYPSPPPNNSMPSLTPQVALQLQASTNLTSTTMAYDTSPQESPSQSSKNSKHTTKPSNTSNTSTHTSRPKTTSHT